MLEEAELVPQSSENGRVGRDLSALLFCTRGQEHKWNGKNDLQMNRMSVFRSLFVIGS